ncbi:hypothetical protein DIPPA_01867 [Diplonema papillatum]|nr:hypothetical protein DIPPA_01867 [Diplonema papillatum]
MKDLVNVLAAPACPDLAEIPNFWVVTRHLIAPFKELAGPLNAHLDSLGLPGGVPPQ